MIPLADCPGVLAGALDFGILPRAALFETYWQKPVICCSSMIVKYARILLANRI
jgi:hypothetical protein